MSSGLPRAFLDAVGTGAARFQSTFRRMAVAEEELARKRFPPGRPAPFRVLAPTAVLGTASLDVYRSHARELLERVERGEKLAPATSAEIVCAMTETALLAPLNAGARFALYRAAERVFTPEELAPLSGLFGQERWPGQAEDILADVARKIVAPWRDEAWPPRAEVARAVGA